MINLDILKDIWLVTEKIQQLKKYNDGQDPKLQAS